MVYINSSGNKRKIKRGSDSNNLLLKTVITHKKYLPIKFKKWMTISQFISFLKSKGVIAGIWDIKDFVYYVNFRAGDINGIEETNIYIEEQGGCIRFRGKDFPITKEEEEWKAIDENMEYYTFLPTKIIEEEIDEIEIALNIDWYNEETYLPFNNTGIILYSQIIPDRMKKVRDILLEKDLLKDYTLVKIRTEVLNREGIKFFIRGADRSIIYTDRVLRNSFSEINVASEISIDIN